MCFYVRIYIMINKKPLLVITLGYPGSGKTYFSERLAKEFNLFHINSDKIRYEIFSNPTFSKEEHYVVFSFIDWLTQELLRKGVSVVVDANHNKYINRVKFLKFASKLKAQHVLVHIKTPVDVAEKRLIKRRNIKNAEKKKYYRPLELSVLHTLKNEIEYPDIKETVLEIDGLEPYRKQVVIFKKWLNDRIQ